MSRAIGLERVAYLAAFAGLALLVLHLTAPAAFLGPGLSRVPFQRVPAPGLLGVKWGAYGWMGAGLALLFAAALLSFAAHRLTPRASKGMMSAGVLQPLALLLACTAVTLLLLHWTGPESRSAVVTHGPMYLPVPGVLGLRWAAAFWLWVAFAIGVVAALAGLVAWRFGPPGGAGKWLLVTAELGLAVIVVLGYRAHTVMESLK